MRRDLVGREENLLLNAKLARLGRAAKRAHDRARQCAAKAVENMVRSGQALCKARDLCETDEWDDFLAIYFGRALRTAQTYMKLARHWSELQAVAPPEALTSQRKALRLLNSLALGEEPPAAAPDARSKKRARRAALELAAPPATAGSGGAAQPPATDHNPAPSAVADEQRRNAVRRMYHQTLGLLSDLTRDLSDLSPPHYLVGSAIQRISCARFEFEQDARKLFDLEAALDASALAPVDDSARQDARGAKSGAARGVDAN